MGTDTAHFTIWLPVADQVTTEGFDDGMHVPQAQYNALHVPCSDSPMSQAAVVVCWEAGVRSMLQFAHVPQRNRRMTMQSVKHIRAVRSLLFSV